MSSRYGHRWVSQYGADVDGLAAAEWRHSVGDVSRAQLNAGFIADACRGDDWPPSSTRFAAMCRGVPSLAEVRADVLHDSVQRHPFTRMVWQHVDGFLFRRAAQGQADSLLRAAYELARERVMRGEPMPPPPAGILVHQRETAREPASAATVAQCLERLRALFGDDDEGALSAEPPRVAT